MTHFDKFLRINNVLNNILNKFYLFYYLQLVTRVNGKILPQCSFVDRLHIWFVSV